MAILTQQQHETTDKDERVKDIKTLIQALEVGSESNVLVDCNLNAFKVCFHYHLGLWNEGMPSNGQYKFSIRKTGDNRVHKVIRIS